MRLERHRLGRRRTRRRPVDDVLDELRRVLGNAVHDDPATRVLYSHDASIIDDGDSGPVCFPTTAEQIQAIMRVARRHSRAVVARGAGTGLAGGAVPLGEAIVVSTARMNEIHEIDLDNRVAWVGPGVVNLDLTRALLPLGFHFAPDPSSQQVCTLGGNVANNSGGPHCLAYGVTSSHVLAVEVVLASGELVLLGGLDAEPAGLDLRGAFIGGEGTLGIATRIAVAITPNAPCVRTLLFGFPSAGDAARTVSAVVAAGIVPAAMEVMDERITAAVEQFVGAGYPTDVGAVLLAEVDGLQHGVALDAARIEEIARAHNATSARTAGNEHERQLLWKGRKTAFGAVAQIAPNYYLHDTVVPRSKLASVLDAVYAIAHEHELLVMNVFHAGDGNLHPLLLFDARDRDAVERVHAAGAAIVRASIAAGGVLSGEHGIGVEKQAFMAEMFSDDDLDHQNRLRRSFDPDCRCNPGKVLPSGHGCADLQLLASADDRIWV